MIQFGAMQPDASAEVKDLMRRSFPRTMRPFLSLSGTVLTAREQDKLLGAVVLNRCCSGSVGLVSWIFTSPDARGRGVAQLLLDEAVQYLSSLGCRDIVAIVQGDNTGSSNRFAEAGFYRTNPLEQVMNFSWSLPAVLIRSLHFFDIGFFLWHKRIDGEPRRSRGIHPLASWLITIGLLWILLPGIHFSALAVVLGFRQAAAVLGYLMVSSEKITYRPWGTGLIVTGVISLIYGGIFPAAGSLYPKGLTWSSSKHTKALGISGLCASWALILAAGLQAAQAVPIHSTGGRLTAALLCFDVLLPFFPFSSFSSARILKYSRILYGCTAAAAAAMLVILLTS